MKVTARQIVSSEEAINALLGIKLPFSQSIALGKVVDEIKPILDKANEARNALLDEMGEVDGEDEQGRKIYKMPSEKQSEFERRVSEIYDDEIELNAKQLDPEKMPDACLEARHVIALGWLFCEKQEAA